MSNPRPHDIIVGRLAGFMGPNTAHVAVRIVAARRFGVELEQLMTADVPALLAELVPLLRALIGGQRAEALIRQLLRELA